MASRQELAARKESEQKGRVSALGVIAPPPIHVESPHFQGSLATLFSFVRDHKVDLLDIPLFPICEAYFSYILQTQVSDLDEAAAALSALAYLLERKAWALLPVPEPEPEYESESEDYEPTIHQYGLAISALSHWYEAREQIFFRSPDAGPDPYELPYQLSNVTAADLARAFERLLNRAQPEPVAPLSKPRKSLEEQMQLVLLAVSDEWRPLEKLVTEPFTREDAVYWFLALLELIRLGQIAARLEGEDVQFARATPDTLPPIEEETTEEVPSRRSRSSRVATT
jgi:segregation and condensation protein A